MSGVGQKRVRLRGVLNDPRAILIVRTPLRVLSGIVGEEEGLFD